MGTTNTLDLNNRVGELEKSYPANKVVMTGGGNVEDALDDMQAFEMLTKSNLIDESTQSSDITLSNFCIFKLKGLPIGRVKMEFQSNTAIGALGVNIGTLKNDIFYSDRPVVACINDSDGTPEGTCYLSKPTQGAVKVYQIKANKSYFVDAFVFLKP